MNQYIKVSLSVVMLVMATCGSVFAVPTIGNRDDFEGSSTAVWTDNGQDLAASDVGAYLQMTITGNGIIQGAGVAYTTSSDFTGNYASMNNQVGVGFSFTTFGVEPSSLALYFETGAGQQWYYSFENNLPTGPGTQNYFAPMGLYTPGWFTTDNSVVDQGLAYTLAITDIALIGVYVSPNSTGVGVYGLDDFFIGVPEPETVWMILAVALSLGMTFRGRLSELAGQMKSRFVKA